jgi:hypothetical protein
MPKRDGVCNPVANILHIGTVFKHFRSSSHAPRGNASLDALRRVTRAAERPRLHSHAERGNDEKTMETERNNPMALTRDFKKTVLERAEREPEFAKALFDEATTLFLKGEAETARLILHELISQRDKMPTPA